MHAVGLVNCLVLVFLTGPGPWSTVGCGLIETFGREHHRVDIRTRGLKPLHDVYVSLAPRTGAFNCFRRPSEIGASSAFRMS
jgi:hypothetical protein